jgi:hypothetical protein
MLSTEVRARVPHVQTMEAPWISRARIVIHVTRVRGLEHTHVPISSHRILGLTSAILFMTTCVAT